MRKLLISLAVLAVLLAAADRIGVAVAENQISGRIETAYGLPAKPGVTIAGFPFLTQVVGGDYQQINVSVNQVQADGVTLHNLTFMALLMEGIRDAVRGGRFDEYAARVMAGDAPYPAAF